MRGRLPLHSWMCLYYRFIFRPENTISSNASDALNGSRTILPTVPTVVMWQRILSKDQNAWRMRMLLMFCAFLLGGFLFSYLESNVGWCLIKKFLGIPCPVCGLTHSIMSFLCGHTADSLTQHPLGPIVGVVCAGFCVYFGTVLVFDRQIKISWSTEASVFRTITSIIFAGLISFWVMRII